jgi:HD-GYP domain-containing protein (c-di-GMP phosphodiesterase class II)
MIKEILATELVVGMYVEKLNGNWQDHPFWRSFFMLRSQKEIDWILASGSKGVWINTAKGLDLPVAEPEPAPPKIPTRKIISTKPKHSIREEIARARKICESSKEAVSSMFREARMGEAVNIEDAEPLVQEIAASVWRNPHALINVARLKTQDDYTYMHSVAVCALMIALGKEMGMSKSEVAAVGMGGLVHDLGKALMPVDVLNKPGKLTEDEFNIMRSHPEKGHDLLLEGRSVGSIALDITLHHHEKVNGLGYPHRLSGNGISSFARMGAICDVYDAITSIRPYKEGWDPALSVKRMANWEGHFDKKFFHSFVRSVGIYPVGSLVRLASDKLGIVVEPGKSKLLTPKVKVFFSLKLRQSIPVSIIDLAAPTVRDRIVGLEDAADWGFRNLQEFWLED